MEHQKQWVNDVFQSIEGIKRATPSVDLFDKINSKLPAKNKTKVISLKKLSWVAAVACFLIALNVFTLKTELNTASNSAYTNLYDTALLNDYKLYE